MWEKPLVALMFASAQAQPECCCLPNWFMQAAVTQLQSLEMGANRTLWLIPAGVLTEPLPIAVCLCAALNWPEEVPWAQAVSENNITSAQFLLQTVAQWCQSPPCVFAYISFEGGKLTYCNLFLIRTQRLFKYLHARRSTEGKSLLLNVAHF